MVRGYLLNHSNLKTCERHPAKADAYMTLQPNILSDAETQEMI